MKKEYYKDCPDYLEAFLVNLKVIKDRADRTEEAYYIDIRTFLRYLRLIHNDAEPDVEFESIEIKNVPISWIKEFKLTDAYQYLKYLKDERNNSAKTRARKASALKQFFSFLHKKSGTLEKDPLTDLELPRIKQALPKYLTLDESLELLDNMNKDSKNYTRDYCILVLFLNCGMRLSELVGLNINDYSEENSTLRLLGKGNKERIVYLNNACRSALNDYLQVRNQIKPKFAEHKNAMFFSSNRTRIAKRRVQQIVEENLNNAGLGNKGITTHKLRHTAATLMYQHGNVDTLVLKDILGHKSIATTEIYTHLSNENLKNAAEANPLANVKKVTNEKSPKTDDE
ncbi:tyrosine recombinase XerC [Ruminococcus sp. NK3A76]|uniref:tyrosine recombinase XerC n=1 Tax=Ruminococcus sp. NK3A76 TaxID=877411 RepID=UPI00048C25A0|nr:tyrosine recombinase XerC [Ruminococcus sp. NK3A76]